MGLDDDDAQAPAWIFKAALALVSIFGALVVVFWLAFAETRQEAIAAAPVSDRPTLVVFESATCSWCRRFRQHVAPAYERSRFDSLAPLKYVDVTQQKASGYRLKGRVTSTPTFVLVDRSGTEVDRIRGLPSARDGFQVEVERLLTKLAAEGARG